MIGSRHVGVCQRLRASVVIFTVLMAGACAWAPERSPTPAEGDGRVVAESMAASMVRIPSGRFVMGSDAGLAEDEHPAHEVEVRAFSLSRYEVTFEQYTAFAAATARPVSAAAHPGHPAINISWDDAQAFVSWLNALSGAQYRLPSEAEWEYAARAGSRSAYWWGDEFIAQNVNGSGSQDGWAETSPVGSFTQNPFGLYDMLGNVWEWTADCYHADYTGASGHSAPRSGPETCGRVLRGGSWSDTAIWLRSATRNWFDRSDRFDYVGFRLAHD